MAIKLIDRGARANVRVLREELVNHRSLDGHPHIIGLKVQDATMRSWHVSCCWGSGLSSLPWRLQPTKPSEWTGSLFIAAWRGSVRDGRAVSGVLPYTEGANEKWL